MTVEEIVDLVEAWEGEVNNGGLHQFFNNSAGDNTAQTIQALEIIGAFKMADILRRAAEKFPGKMPPKDREARMEVLWREYPNPEAFYPLNDEFYAYPDDLAGLLAKFKNGRVAQV
jgi:uncharacterized protein DUF4375